jgi:hypothetical protein
MKEHGIGRGSTSDCFLCCRCEAIVERVIADAVRYGQSLGTERTIRDGRCVRCGWPGGPMPHECVGALS